MRVLAACLFWRQSMTVAWLCCVLALLALPQARAADSEAAKDTLPSCETARQLYEQNKLYDCLGVTKSATEQQIKRNFRRLSVQCA
jgi:hypothetical protein